MFNYTKAMVTIEGIAPYSQSKHHDEPMLEGENHGDYDRRTWRSHMTVSTNGYVAISGHGMMQCIVSGAIHAKKKVEGGRGAFWGKRFAEGGFAIIQDVELNVKAEDVGVVSFYANLDGVRGSGKRGTRHYPIVPAGWQATFEVMILDPSITQAIFTEMLERAGMFIGVGRFRPQKGGLNGRFAVTKVEWVDNRQPVFVQRKKAA